MRYFLFLDFQYVILAAFLGLAALALLWVFFRSYNTPRQGKQASPDKTITLLDHQEEGYSPFPSLIIFLLGGIIVWAVIYVTFIGIKGPTF